MDFTKRVYIKSLNNRILIDLYYKYIQYKLFACYTFYNKDYNKDNQLILILNCKFLLARNLQ